MKSVGTSSKTLLISIIIGAVLLLIGYSFGRGQKEIQTVEKIIEGKKEIKIVEVTKWKERIVQPDGTIIEREGTKEKEKDVKDERIIKEKETFSKPTSRDYSLGILISAPIAIESTFKRPEIGIEGGRRVLGDFWLTGSLNEAKIVTLGVRYEF